MAKASTQKKTSLEPSEVFCAVGLLMPSDDMKSLVKDETGRDMHKSWGNAIWFEDAAEKMGVDVMRWMYALQNVEQNLLFGYGPADEVRKKLITLWNVYSFYATYASVDGLDRVANQ